MFDDHVVCPFCGQIIQTEADLNGMSEADRHLLAIELCSCGEAKETWRDHKWRIDRIKKTNEALDDLFRDGVGNYIEEEHRWIALEQLKSAVESVVDGHLFGVTILIPGGVKVTIAQGSKGAIKVDRSDTTKHKREI